MRSKPITDEEEVDTDEDEQDSDEESDSDDNELNGSDEDSLPGTDDSEEDSGTNSYEEEENDSENKDVLQRSLQLVPAQRAPVRQSTPSAAVNDGISLRFSTTANDGRFGAVCGAIAVVFRARLSPKIKVSTSGQTIRVSSVSPFFFLGMTERRHIDCSEQGDVQNSLVVANVKALAVMKKTLVGKNTTGRSWVSALVTALKKHGWKGFSYSNT